MNEMNVNQLFPVISIELIIGVLWCVIGFLTMFTKVNIFMTYDKKGEIDRFFGKPKEIKVYHIFNIILMLEAMIICGILYISLRLLWKAIIYPVGYFVYRCANVTLWKSKET